jgi:hypothetical protein
MAVDPRRLCSQYTRGWRTSSRERSRQTLMQTKHTAPRLRPKLVARDEPVAPLEADGWFAVLAPMPPLRGWGASSHHGGSDARSGARVVALQNELRTSTSAERRRTFLPSWPPGWVLYAALMHPMHEGRPR